MAKRFVFCGCYVCEVLMDNIYVFVVLIAKEMAKQFLFCGYECKVLMDNDHVFVVLIAKKTQLCK